VSRGSSSRRPAADRPIHRRAGRVLVRAAIVALVVVGGVFVLLWAFLVVLGRPLGLAPVLLLWALVVLASAVGLTGWRLAAWLDS
jgi:hypothetical protein